MLYLILTLEIALAIFLLGVLGIALAVTLRHGDPSATYGLYAVRDKLIDACVFKGISRANPWLDSLYENINTVLVRSNMPSGPARWSFALAVGHYQASHPSAAGKLKPFPHDPRRCPEPIRALIPEIRTALERLSERHIGVMLQMNAREREERRIQRERAGQLLQMMRADHPWRCAAAP
jgi:hypothetical protein